MTIGCLVYYGLEVLPHGVDVVVVSVQKVLSVVVKMLFDGIYIGFLPQFDGSTCRSWSVQ